MEKESPDLHSFLQLMEEQLDNIVPGTLQSGTEFRSLPQWNSLQALVVVSALNWKYGITVAAQELREATTMEDLFIMLIKKLNE